MRLNWFGTAWPFTGLGGAIAMVAVMLTTDTFRGTKCSAVREPRGGCGRESVALRAQQ
jgi:hypothetical protein